jgi:hypothetical protein
MTGSPFFIAADAQFRSCGVLHDFIDRVVLRAVEQAVDRADPLQATCRAYMYRVATWLSTLSKLNHPSDVQAIDAAARSLFEVVIDLTLLRYDRDDNPIQKMLDWELSARFKRFQLRRPVLETMSDEHSKRLAAVAKDCIETNDTRVQAARAKWGWDHNKNAHPSRWTGRNLFDDAKRCDEVSKSTAHANHHRLRHTDLCWNTHGSAFAGVRGLDDHAVVAGVAQSLKDCFRMAREAAEHALVILGCYDDAMVAQFACLGEDSTTAMAGAFQAGPAQQSHQAGHGTGPASRGRKYRRSTGRQPESVEATRTAGALWRTRGAAYDVWKNADARHFKHQRSKDLVLVVDASHGHRVMVLRGDRMVWVDPRHFEDIALPDNQPTSDD